MITVEKILFLKRIPIFKSLNTTELRMIAEVTLEEEFSVGEVIFSEGQTGDCMYFVFEGRINIFAGAPPKIQVLRVFESGDFFGEMGLFDDKPRAASAMAIDPARVLVLRKGDFCELISEYPEVALSIMKELNQRIRATNQKLTSVEARLMDKTSQVYSREYFIECMFNIFLKAKKEEVSLAFLTLRMDLKNVDGAPIALDSLREQLMGEIGRILLLHQRPNDLSARFSGEKLVVLLYEAQKEGARAFHRRIQKDVEKCLISFQEGRDLRANMHIAILSFPEDTLEREGMLSLIEKA